MLAVALLGGCPQAETLQPVTPTLLEEEAPPALRILRAEYEAVLKGGLQPVMRWVLTLPAYDAAERFLGYRVVRILRDELKDGPIQEGDILVRVNGASIETPGHVEAVWRELWSRKSLSLSLLRDGRPVELVIPIVESSEPVPDAE